MKKFINMIIMTVVFACNVAQADVAATTRYILDTVPGATDATAQSCAKAYYHGGTYRHMDTQMTLTCTKNTIRKEWDPSN